MIKYLLIFATLTGYSQDNIQKYLLQEINEWRDFPAKKLFEYKANNKDYDICKLKRNKTKLIFNEKLSKECFMIAEEISITNVFNKNQRLGYNLIYYKGWVSTCINDLILKENPNKISSKEIQKMLLGIDTYYKDNVYIGIGYKYLKNNIVIIIIAIY